MNLDDLVNQYSANSSDGAAPPALPVASRVVFVPKAKSLIGHDAWLTLRSLSPNQEAAATRIKTKKRGEQPSPMETALSWSKASMWRFYDHEPEDGQVGGTVVMSKHRELLWELLGSGGRGHVMAEYMELAGMLDAEEDEESEEGNA